MSLETNDKETLGEFKQAVNMTTGQIENWLDGDESKRVGFKSEVTTNQSVINRANASSKFWGKSRTNTPPTISNL